MKATTVRRSQDYAPNPGIGMVRCPHVTCFKYGSTLTLDTLYVHLMSRYTDLIFVMQEDVAAKKRPCKNCVPRSRKGTIMYKPGTPQRSTTALSAHERLRRFLLKAENSAALADSRICCWYSPSSWKAQAHEGYRFT